MNLDMRDVFLINKDRLLFSPAGRSVMMHAKIL